MDKERYKARTKNVIKNICISTIILFVGIIMICKSFVIKKEEKNVLYSYNLFQNVNYTVTLKENDLFTTEELGMDRAYVTDLVDKINMDFSYSLSGNRKGNIKYTYQIVADTKMEYSSSDNENGKIIWENQDFLLEPKEAQVDKSNYAINEHVELNFAEYNTKISEFAKSYRIPVNARLEVKLIIISESDIEGIEDTINEYSVMNVKMNLNESVFTVDKQFEQTDTKSIEELKEEEKHVVKPLITAGIILVVVALMIMLDSIRKSIKFSEKSDYAIALNRILKNYGDIVAEIVSPIEIDNLNVIEVKNFDQLLDIEEEIRMPILFYEIVEGESGEFIIICDNMAYRYGIGR